MNCPACNHPNQDAARFCAKCGAPVPSAGSPDDPLIGQIVGGRYRIVKLLGEGGMGRVYVGEQQMGDNVRKVAVKTLHDHLSKDAQLVARFHRECGTVSQLEHPNTIHFYDFGQTPSGQLYIAMEFIEGDSLENVLRTKGALPPDRVAHIVGQICGSLEEAHAHGIVHRDLKPDNVILTVRAGQPDFVKVLDFGIAKRKEAAEAKQQEKLTQQGTVLGTPPYMSPEQFTGKELDARSDVYSLAVMTYEMLTGKLPYDAENPWQWATQHLTAQPFPFEVTAPHASIPPRMKAAILRALGKRPEERPKSARDYLDELAGPEARAAFGSGPQVQAAPRGGTSAMDAVEAGGGGKGGTQVGAPAFAGGAQAAGPGPMGAGAGGAPFVAPAHPTPMGGQTFPTPPGPSPAGRGAQGGKGLVIGLAAAGGVVVLVGIVLAARGLRKDADPNITLPAGSGTGETNVQFVQADAMASASASATATAKPVVTVATAKPTATATSTAKGDEACVQSRTRANAGDVLGAVALFHNCDGPNKESARAAIRSACPGAVRSRAFNGDCAGAKSTAAACNSAGAGGPAQAELANHPKCK